jgi:hypothetical protein
MEPLCFNEVKYLAAVLPLLIHETFASTLSNFLCLRLPQVDSWSAMNYETVSEPQTF